MSSQRFPFMVGSAQDPSLHERYLASTVLWSIRLPDSHFSSLAVTLVGRYFPTGRAIRISHVHLSALVPCRALRPRRRSISLPISDIWNSAFKFINTLSHLRIRINGAQSLQPTAYGLQPPCLRLTYVVTNASSRLGMECVGSTLLQSHFQRPADKHLVAH